MHEDTLNKMAVVSLGDLVDGLGHLGVGVTGLDHAVAEITHGGNAAHQVILYVNGGKRKNDFSLLLFGHGFIGNHNGVSSESDVTINVATNINLDNITSLKRDGLVGKRRVVANDIVHRNTGREGNTLLNTLVLEDTFALLLDKKITKGTDIRNKLSSYTLHIKQKRKNYLRNNTLESFVGNFSSSLIL